MSLGCVGEVCVVGRAKGQRSLAQWPSRGSTQPRCAWAWRGFGTRPLAHAPTCATILAMGIDATNNVLSAGLNTNNVLSAGLKLTPRERAAVALGLLESLDDEDCDGPGEKWDEVWAIEVKQRLAELDSGNAREIDAFEAIAALRAELRK